MNTIPTRTEEELLMPTLTVGESAVFAHQMSSIGRTKKGETATVRAVLERLGLLELWETKVMHGAKRFNAKSKEIV